MKKFMTVALATAMTAAMACTAFAGTGVVDYNGLSSSDSYGEFINPGQYVKDITTIASIELKTDAAFSGCYEVSANSDNWGWDAVEVTESDDVVIPCAFTADDVDDNMDGFAKVQIQYWTDDATATVKVVDMIIKDAAGNVLYESAAPTADVAPVAYLAAIVAVAGIAMVASKKRA